MNPVQANHLSVVRPVLRALSAVRSDWANYRAQRAEENRVAAELSAYRTPAEIEDLLATLDRGEGRQVELMRTQLTENLAHYYRTQARAA